MDDEELLLRPIGRLSAKWREVFEWMRSDEGRAAIAEEMHDEEDAEVREILGFMVSDEGDETLERVAERQKRLDQQLDHPENN